jgi:hypothetical protein
MPPLPYNESPLAVTPKDHPNGAPCYKSNARCGGDGQVSGAMDAVNHTMHIVGGSKYMEENTVTAALYLAISGTACVVGTIGNILILCAVLLYKPLKHRRNAFVVNLAIADLTVTSFADPMGILGRWIAMGCRCVVKIEFPSGLNHILWIGINPKAAGIHFGKHSLESHQITVALIIIINAWVCYILDSSCFFHALLIL